MAEIPGGRIAPTQGTPEEDDPDGRAPHVSDRVEKPTARQVECLASGPRVSALVFPELGRAHRNLVTGPKVGLVGPREQFCYYFFPLFSSLLFLLF